MNTVKNVVKKIGFLIGVSIALIICWPIVFIWYFMDNQENSIEGVVTTFMAEIVYLVGMSWLLPV